MGERQNYKILFIEDDEFLIGLIVKHFQKEGLNFDMATTGEKGLEKARAASYDLILLDIVLPGMDGYEVLRQLKSDSELAKIPVIILSNLGQKAEIQRGLELGAEDFLVKARHDLDEIGEKIKKFLKKVE